jgi:hypothetical protein
VQQGNVVVNQPDKQQCRLGDSSTIISCSRLLTQTPHASSVVCQCMLAQVGAQSMTVVHCNIKSWDVQHCGMPKVCPIAPVGATMHCTQLQPRTWTAVCCVLHCYVVTLTARKLELRALAYHCSRNPRSALLLQLIGQMRDICCSMASLAGLLHRLFSRLPRIMSQTLHGSTVAGLGDTNKGIG